MWEVDEKTKKARRKAKIIMAAICGPIFAVLLSLTTFILILVPETWLEKERYWMQISFMTSIAAMIFVADRLGKRLKLTASQFAAPVAYSCAGFTAIAVWLYIITH